MNKQINSFFDLDKTLTRDSKPLVLFSGGLDGSYLLHWLIHQKKISAQPIALTLDLGGDGDSEHAKINAERLGAQSIVLEKKEEFANDYVIPAIFAHSTYLGHHPISASLSRPLLAKCAMEVAEENGCDLIIHSATVSQNSMRRFNGAFKALKYTGNYGSPFQYTPISRVEKSKVLKDLNIDKVAERGYSTDSNFWCREFEAGFLDNIENYRWPDDLFLWSKLDDASASEMISVSIKNGIPCAINGVSMNFIQLVTQLNKQVGKYELGRYLGLEELEGGVKFPEVREMPAAFLLLAAYRDLESACLDANSIKEKLSIEQMWVQEAVEGRWFFGLREAAHHFFASAR